MLKQLFIITLPVLLLACDRQESFGEEVREAVNSKPGEVGEQLKDVANSVGNKRSETDKKVDKFMRDTEKWLEGRGDDASESTMSVRKSLDAFSKRVEESADQAGAELDKTGAELDEMMQSIQDSITKSDAAKAKK